MSFKSPKGWQAENDKLFIHRSGVRLQRTAYRGEEGWFIISVDIEQEVGKFEPTPAGRDKAFAAFAAGEFDLKRKPKKPAAEPKPARGRKRKSIAAPGEETADGDHPPAAKEEAEEKDEDEDEEKEKEDDEEDETPAET